MDNLTLLIVDPLVSAVSGDSHKNAEVRRGLAPLVEFAASKDAALIGITHYSKGTQGRDPLERVSGSLAFGALARVVMGTVRMQGDEDGAERRFTLARAKSNIGPDGGGFAYTFEQDDLQGHAGVTASRISWGAAIEGTARELLTEAEPDTDAGHDAASFLRDLLAFGSRPAKEVFSEAASAGYSRDAMQRAKRKIGAEAVKVGMAGGWVWRLQSAEGGAEGSEGGGQNRPLPSPSSGAEPPPSGQFEEVLEL
jgi:putative DNA primase/helicase